MSTPIPLAVQLACVRREIAMRDRVYQCLVLAGKMPRAAAERELATMEAVLQSLLRLQTQEAAQQALWPCETKGA